MSETPGPTSPLRSIGPGIVAAATGVGAGDLVATLVAGSQFGYTLLWAAIVGCIVKIALGEGVARYSLVTGQTIFHGWRTLGGWASVYFGLYIVVWGLIYGATAMSATALPLYALFPAVPFKVWAVLCGVSGLAFVWVGHYRALEAVMKLLIGLMFVIIVGLAMLVAPNLGEIVRGLVPLIPDGALFYTLGLIGGVGGTITVAAYGYWIGTKGWEGPQWLKTMRLDNAVGYAATGIFVAAMLIVGAELLYSAQLALAKGSDGLVDLSDILAERFGSTIAVLFLVGFAASTLSSLFGVWHGVSLMFADFVHHILPNSRAASFDGGTSPVPLPTSQSVQSRWEVGRGSGPEPGPSVSEENKLERSPAFRAYLLWLTFPPMALLFLNKPIFLVILYGAFGAFFMPFLAITLLVLLNRREMEAHRSGWLSNGMLGASAALFLALCGQQIVELIGGA